jgi:hypothetical protein
MERTVEAGLSAGLDLLLAGEYNRLEERWEKSELGKMMIVTLRPQGGQRFSVYCAHKSHGDFTTSAKAKAVVLTRVRSMTRVTRRRPFVVIPRNDNELVYLFIR